MIFQIGIDEILLILVDELLSICNIIAKKMSPERTQSGKFRSRRSDTKVSTIEKQYNVDLGVRSDMKLGNYLERKGYSSLSKLLKDV